MRVRPSPLALLLSSLLSLAALGGCHGKEHGHAAGTATATAARVVTAARARTTPVARTYRASGTVRGHQTAVLTSKTVGYLRTLDVRAGDRIVAGQLLGTLEANDARAGFRAAEARLDEVVASRVEAENAVKAAESAAALAKSTRDRTAALFAKSAVAPQEIDDAEHRSRSAEAALDMARARLAALGSRIDAAKADVGAARATLGYASLVAPFSGRVLERRADPGALAAPGTPLLVVEDDGRPHVEASVDEGRGAAVHLGDVADLEIERESDVARVTGTVTEIVPAVDTSSRAFVIKVELPEGTTARPGAFARAIFRVGSEPRLVVPSGAVGTHGAIERVFVVSDGAARLRVVTTGERVGEDVVVLSGLGDGETVVSPLPADLFDGAPVAASSAPTVSADAGAGR